MIEARATGKYIRTSAQKAGLVLDLIRGRDVNQALATLRFARKGVARDIEKVLRSAIANASQKDGFGGDVERLYVNACYANQGPSQKRIRPAPMGRAFRVIKRTAHLTVQVAERPLEEDREELRLRANGDLWVRKYIRTDSGWDSTRRGVRDGSPTRTIRSCFTRTSSCATR